MSVPSMWIHTSLRGARYLFASSICLTAKCEESVSYCVNRMRGNFIHTFLRAPKNAEGFLSRWGLGMIYLVGRGLEILLEFHTEYLDYFGI